jgi:hypothetical protein
MSQPHDPLPAHAGAEAQRILDVEARRLLAEQLDADSAQHDQARAQRSGEG